MDHEIANINANAMLGQELRRVSTKAINRIKKCAHAKALSDDYR